VELNEAAFAGKPFQAWHRPFIIEAGGISATSDPQKNTLDFGSPILAAAYASSSPRMVPVEEANLSDSMPMRWSMET
jgi:hypothetical protein